MPYTPGPQIQSMVLTPPHSYNETDSYESNVLKDLQTEMAALKSVVLKQFSIIKQNVKLNCEHSPNAESSGDDREFTNSLLGQIDHLKRELDGKKT